MTQVFFKMVRAVKEWSLPRKILAALFLPVLVIFVFLLSSPEDNSKNVVTDVVRISDIRKTILVTGQVVSNTDIDLSFGKSGVVKKVNVRVGDRVKAGEVLASLEQDNELSSLTSARGTLASARAKLERLLAGASSAEIDLAEVLLANAKLDYERKKSEQDTLVSNAYKNLLNSTIEALPAGGGNDYAAPTISGVYGKGVEGQIVVSLYNSGNGPTFSASGLAVGTGPVTVTTPQPIGDSGLYITFPSSGNINVMQWVINIPNKKAANYLANKNAYDAALEARDSILGSARAAIATRESELRLKKSAARPADVALAEAEILSAEGGLALARANLERTLLRAPASGVVTKVGVKIGELAQAFASVFRIEDTENLYLEANVNEANVGSVRIGAEVFVTFDAFGDERIWNGRVLKVDPSATFISGVVNYLVTAGVVDPPALRPGMTANMSILAGERTGVFVVPARAILRDKSGRKTVRLVNDSKRKTWNEVEVFTGLEGDGGLVEVVSGLQEGDEVVVQVKK